MSSQKPKYLTSWLWFEKSKGWELLPYFQITLEKDRYPFFKKWDLTFTVSWLNRWCSCSICRTDFFDNNEFEYEPLEDPAFRTHPLHPDNRNYES